MLPVTQRILSKSFFPAFGPFGAAVGTAALGAASGLAGGIISTLGSMRNQDKVNQANKDINKEQLAWAKQQHQENMAFQQQQFDYQKALNAQMMDYQSTQDALTREREDNAMQRSVADYQAAGLSPLAAAGNAAGASAVSAPSLSGTSMSGDTSSYNPASMQASADFSGFASAGNAVSQALSNYENNIVKQDISKQQLAQQFVIHLMDYLKSGSEFAVTSGETSRHNKEMESIASKNADTSAKSAALRDVYQKALNKYAEDNPSEVFGRDMSALGIVADLMSEALGTKATRNPLKSLVDVATGSDSSVSSDGTVKFSFNGPGAAAYYEARKSATDIGSAVAFARRAAVERGKGTLANFETEFRDTPYYKSLSGAERKDLDKRLHYYYSQK